jgi:hypothetical protein
MRKVAVAAAAATALWLAPGAFASGWCGSGEQTPDRPDVVTGQQIHAVYAVPADAPDNFANVANLIQDDVTTLKAWWITQDATRTPRFDDAAFAGGPCLDISFVRLPETASAFTDAGSAYTEIRRDLVAAGLANRFKKYYVYYDGPSVQEDICGTGSGDFDTGPDYAIVWLQGCPTVPSSAVGTHELVHALGAVPAGAPHECPPPNDGHVCDSDRDLLYPFTTGDPLANLVLDVNHDDYYGHATNGIDLRNSLWLSRLDAPQVPLSVAFAGAGRVVSDVPGVDCSADCTTQWDTGARATLIASGATGTRFVQWQGACSGVFSRCAVTLGAATAVSAIFGPVRIPVSVTTAGRGAVVCTPRCSRSFRAGAGLTLRAVATKGWRFVRWNGACAGTRPVCRPRTDFALSVRAVFRRR